MALHSERWKYIGLFIAPLGITIIPFMLVLTKDDKGYRHEYCHEFAVEQAIAEDENREQAVEQLQPNDSAQADLEYRDNPFQVGTETYEDFQEQVHTDLEEGPMYNETSPTTSYDGFVYQEYYDECITREE